MSQSDKFLEKINPLDILTRLNWGESDDLEFKSAKGGLPQSMWETYSSMANSQGGVILLGVENDGNVSECRNKSLQTMFMMIGAAEKAGSGIDKIKRGWASQHWRFPKVSEQVKPDRVQWILPMMSLISDESLVRLKARFSVSFQNCSKLEVQALVTADVEGVVDNSRMRQITGEHATDMTILLQCLVSKGFLVQEGQGRWTRYRLPEISNSVHKDSDSLHSGEFTKDVWTDLMQIAEPSRTCRRLLPKRMEEIILSLCQTRWLTRRNLSDLLKRHPDGLRTRFITQMVEHSLLRLRFPDKPNRTDQAYIAV